MVRRLPRPRCGVVDGFSAAVVVCRASLRKRRRAYSRARTGRLLESYMPLAALVTPGQVFRHNVRYLCT